MRSDHLGWGLLFIHDMPTPAIRRLAATELDLIEPLWNALREHHSSVTPDLGEPRPRADSWQRRRGQYEGWLATSDAFVLLAEREGTPVGYAMVQVRQGSSTWPISERAGEIETLSVLPEERNRGTGSALLQEVRRQLGERDITELSLHVMHTNDEALRFYESHGFKPFAVWVRSDRPPHSR
jgi:ribosomal protein S18 acetylase RimI-like enzyme